MTLCVVQTGENHLGLGLTSTAVMVDTESGGARMVQQLHGKYGANHCHVAT